MNKARANCEPLDVTFHSLALRVRLIGWKPTTSLKKLKDESPSGVYGKYVNDVSRLDDVRSVEHAGI